MAFQRRCSAVFLFFLTTVCCFGQSQYFPLEVGNRWSYNAPREFIEWPNREIVTVVDTETIGPFRYYVLVNSGEIDSLLLRVSADSVLQYSETDPAGTLLFRFSGVPGDTIWTRQWGGGGHISRILTRSFDTLIFNRSEHAVEFGERITGVNYDYRNYVFVQNIGLTSCSGDAWIHSWPLTGASVHQEFIGTAFDTTSGPLGDVFPLALGNQWRYSYYHSLRSWSDITADSGSISYKIIDSAHSSRAVSWKIEEHKIGERFSYYPRVGLGHVDTVITRALIEQTSSRHGINGELESRLIFSRFCVDSEKTSRYQVINTAGFAYLRYESNWYNPSNFEFYYRFKQGTGLIDAAVTSWEGDVYYSDTLKMHLVSSVVNGVEHVPAPSAFLLRQNYPNPFNPQTTISFSLPQESYVRIDIFNMVGEQVATLLNAKQPPGNHQVTWNAAGAPSGVYFYSLMAGSIRQIGKMVLLR